MRVNSTRYWARQVGSRRDLMLCSVAQLPGLGDDDSIWPDFKLLFICFGSLWKAQPVHFVLILNGEANIYGSQVRAGRLWNFSDQHFSLL